MVCADGGLRQRLAHLARGVPAPSSRAVSEFVRAYEERVDFFMWLQWIADQQLSAAQSAGRDAGMSLGLVCDMAVGVSGAGADALMLGELFADGVSVGSPPDAFNQAGQEWGQPPILADLAYQPFRDMVRAALRHAGGIRIDHILGLFRLWWVPAGLGPRMGTYVRYDHEAMVGVLALEAELAGVVVAPFASGLAALTEDMRWNALGVIAGLGLVWLLARLERSGAALRLLPSGSFSIRTRIGSIYACMSLLGIGVTSEIFVPYFLQTIHGRSPLAAGYLTALMAAGWSIGSMFSAGRSATAAQRLSRAGPLVAALGLAALAWLMPIAGLFDGSAGTLALCAALMSVGLGVGIGWPHLLTRTHMWPGRSPTRSSRS